MVMNNENIQADVVFLIEATAHISPYVESLKTNYIIPTLEYFSSALSDDRDYGGDANPNSTLFGIVAFMSNDCKPDSASVCYAPTSNSSTCLQWLDKIQFIGGAGNPSSHIVEGLSTAINLLDDFRSFREKSSSRIDMNGTLKSSKHCILICNSTPYLEPAVENPIYCGYTIDQLMKVMTEKNINFSIFSPRKIQFLYKLFENAGGSLTNALTKNYAKDRRHLVLLNGFHLQEKPMSPSSQPPSTEHTGLKRPLSPSSNSNLMMPNPQMRNSQLSSLITGEPGTPFGQQHPKMAGDMSMQPRGSPWPANSSVPSPSQGPRNPSLPPVRARVATPQMAGANLQNMNPVPSPGQIPNLVPQVSPASKPAQLNPGNVQLRPNNPNMNQIRPQQMQSPFPALQAPSPSQPQPSPLGMRAVPSPIQNSAPSPISQPQQFIQQQQINQINQQQHQLNPMNPQGPNAMSSIQGNMPVNSTVPTMMTGQRTRIWSGIIEYHDKQPPAMAKMMYHLECQITYQHNNNEPEFSSQGWPEKMLINTVPKLLINRLSPIFKNNSYHVNLHFTNDSLGLQKLLKAMSANSVGCIQLPNPANIRIIIILYMPDKKLFVGFIPHNQDEFMTSMKELIESHKKEQAVKQQQHKMLSHMQMTMGHQQQMQQGQSAVLPNQATNAPPQLAQMSGPLSIQLSHGQLAAQSAQTGTAQIMPSNSANTMFQLQQMNNNPNIQANPNANIAGTGAQVPMSQASAAPPGGSMLLNQTLTSIPGSNQAKNSVFIGSTPGNANQMATATTNAGMQIALNSTPNAGIGQNHQANMPSMGQQQMMQQQQQQQNAPNPGQQFGMMPNSQQQQQQLNNMRAANAAAINAASAGGTAGGFGSHDREQNLIAIKQLELNLKEAQKREMEYQMQHQHPDAQKPGQPIANATLQQQQQPQQPQQNSAVRQHLQHQLQQKQMIHMQQQQQQQHQVNINNNLQLRHLLQQQQQLRTMNPAARMQTSTVGVSHQQTQQPQIMLQQGSQMAQQQQFRFQTPIQTQQQPAQQTAASQQQAHGRNFFEEY